MNEETLDIIIGLEEEEGLSFFSFSHKTKKPKTKTKTKKNTKNTNKKCVSTTDRPTDECKKISLV